MSISSDIDNELPPERRFRLYMRLHELFKDHGADAAAQTALSLAHEAAQQSPEIKREMAIYLEALRENVDA